MKVRCSGCGKVVKVSGPDLEAGRTCPECGSGLFERQRERHDSPGLSAKRGKLPTQNRAIIFVGVVIVFLVLCFFGTVASVAQEGSTFAWLAVVLVGIITTVALGLWFHNRSRREKE